MNLPPKAITVLVDLKAELLSKQEEPKQPAEIRLEPERRTPEHTMRGARRVGRGYQLMCQSRNW